jgi:tetratricopeptide (TPR) repeat protein
MMADKLTHSFIGQKLESYEILSLLGLSECLSVQRRFEEAIAEVTRAPDLDPLSLHMNAALSLTCYSTRRYDEAVEHGRRTVELDPNFFPGYFYLGLAHSAQGQHSEAVAALERATALSNRSTLMLGALGEALASWGKEDDARQILRELEELNGKTYVSQVFVAAIYAGLGENAQALACLERACEDRCAWLLRCLVSESGSTRCAMKRCFAACFGAQA